MCGIAGFIGNGSRADLHAMTSRLEHRGPDSHGHWWDETKQIFLGHTRLAIVDLAGGQQPMWTSDNDLCIIFNGEIYNHIELRSELQTKGHAFSTDHSDTEVLLHGYREWGVELPNHLNGMWAFAIYDRQRSSLFLSRDRFGKKPLYYTSQNGVFAFASELTALVTHGKIFTTVSRLSVQKYFAYGFIPAPSSWYEKIYKLPGGFNLQLDCDTLQYRVKQYWEFLLEPEDPAGGFGRKQLELLSDQLLDLLMKSVKRRLQADVPVGIFLSGGVDSSSVAACAVRQHQEGHVKTFSIGFDERTFDESYYAEKVARLLGTEHHQHSFSGRGEENTAAEVIARLDEPMGDSSLLPTYLLCQHTRKYVTVALGGDGADELFAGYDPFHVLQKAEIYSRLVPGCVHEAIRLIAARLPVSLGNMSFDFKLKRALRGLSYPRPLWNPVWLGPLEPRELAEAFGEPVDVEAVYSEAIAAWDACKSKDILSKTLQFFTRLYLQDAILTKVDRASMLNSLEVRTPYLDIDLVDFARKLPVNYKYFRGETKFILKKTLSRLLPQEILHRRKKGFGIPVARLFRDQRLQVHSDPLSSLLDSGFVSKKTEEHLKGTADNRLFLWNYWVCERYRATSIIAGK